MLARLSTRVTKCCVKTQANTTSTTQKRKLGHGFWDHVEMGPPDPILGITEAFQRDTDSSKINLGVGAYRDDSGKPFVLESVKKAEHKIVNDGSNHEYGPITGTPAFRSAAQKLLFGENSPALAENRVASAQAISGTGALRLAGDFMKRFLVNNKEIYLSNPTWANHLPLFKDAGFKTMPYHFYRKDTKGLDFETFHDSLQLMPLRSPVVLHLCAHNPTGVDPTENEWRELMEVIKERDHMVLFDSAYQGFASGDPKKDTFALDLAIEQGINPIICQSFAKNFGLYGERVGCLHIVGENEAKAKELESQLKILIRPQYSNPPIHGARIVSTILNDPELTTLWRSEVKGMADRIIKMRELLVKGLKDNGSKLDWSHITTQIGMFCFSGLTPEQVDRLKEEFHIYMVRSGRISMAGVTSGNVNYLAKAMHVVTSS